ncbi:MAG: hypothetical protein NTW95_00720 [Candidatus Aminicenantes bacterium]|nr:hypothetical protein [Candidatus Aminicenantes bacterium]
MKKLKVLLLAIFLTVVAIAGLACQRDKEPVEPGNNDLSTPGGLIAFYSERDGNYEVYTMKADGTEQKRLTSNPYWDGWPGWGKKD